MTQREAIILLAKCVRLVNRCAHENNPGRNIDAEYVENETREILLGLDREPEESDGKEAKVSK